VVSREVSPYLVAGTLGDNRTGRCCTEAPFDVGGKKIKRLDLKNCELFRSEGEADG
jgi:hypothetical protein